MEERPDTELVTFCITAWEKLAAVVAEAHAWLGARYEPVARCRHGVERYGLLLESDLFPEVCKAWAGPPTHALAPRGDELSLVAAPHDGAEVWHLVHRPATVKGWLTNTNTQSEWWPPTYRSLLIHTIGDAEVLENTAAFFEARKAVVTELPETEQEE